MATWVRLQIMAAKAGVPLQQLLEMKVEEYVARVKARKESLS